MDPAALHILCDHAAPRLPNSAELLRVRHRPDAPRCQGGRLNPGECARAGLAGAFRADPLAPDEDVNRNLIEEAQVRARLEGLPGGYWATLRGSGCADALCFDVLRLGL